MRELLVETRNEGLGAGSLLLHACLGRLEGLNFLLRRLNASKGLHVLLGIDGIEFRYETLHASLPRIDLPSQTCLLCFKCRLVNLKLTTLGFGWRRRFLLCTQLFLGLLERFGGFLCHLAKELVALTKKNQLLIGLPNLGGICLSLTGGSGIFLVRGIASTSVKNLQLGTSFVEASLGNSSGSTLTLGRSTSGFQLGIVHLPLRAEETDHFAEVGYGLAQNTRVLSRFSSTTLSAFLGYSCNLVVLVLLDGGCQCLHLTMKEIVLTANLLQTLLRLLERFLKPRLALLPDLLLAFELSPGRFQLRLGGLAKTNFSLILLTSTAELGPGVGMQSQLSLVVVLGSSCVGLVRFHLRSDGLHSRLCRLGVLLGTGNLGLHGFDLGLEVRNHLLLLTTAARKVLAELIEHVLLCLGSTLRCLDFLLELFNLSLGLLLVLTRCLGQVGKGRLVGLGDILEIFNPLFGGGQLRTRRFQVGAQSGKLVFTVVVLISFSELALGLGQRQFQTGAPLRKSLVV